MPPWTTPPPVPPPGVRRVLRDGPAGGGRVSPTFGEHRRDMEDRVFRGTQLLPQLRHPSSQVADHSLAINREIANAILKIFEGARNARGGQ